MAFSKMINKTRHSAYKQSQQSVVMLSVTYAVCHIQALYDVCRYAECRYAGHCYAKCRSAEYSTTVKSFMAEG